jgi:hypothetical protein
MPRVGLEPTSPVFEQEKTVNIYLILEFSHLRLVETEYVNNYIYGLLSVKLFS